MKEIRWLKPDSEVVEGLEQIVEKKAKTIRKASPYGQTCGVEGYHAVVNHFAPKMFHFSYIGMKTRLYLAAMHYNENNMRQPQRNRKGQVEYNIAFPKYKKGKFTVKTLMTKPTYNYIANLLEEIFTVVENPTNYTDLKLDENIPLPLCSKYVRPIKEQAVREHKSRFNQF